MNDIQKKSLFITILLAVNYYLIASFSNIFRYIILLAIVILVITGIYFFNIKKTKNDILEKYKFLILPLLFNIGGFFFVASLFAPVTKILFSTFFVILNYYLYVALKRVQNLEEKAAIFQRNLLVTISFLTLLLTLSATFRSYVSLSTSASFRLPVLFVVILTGSVFYFISYFLAWEYGINQSKFKSYNLVNSLLASEIALISVIWIINYPVFSNIEKATLGGVPFPAIYLTIIFYFIWGIMSHKMDRSLTRKVMTEYIVLTLLFLTILLFTAKWLPIL